MAPAPPVPLWSYQSAVSATCAPNHSTTPQVVTPCLTEHMLPDGSTVKLSVITVSLSPVYDPLTRSGVVALSRLPPRIVNSRPSPPTGSIVLATLGSSGIPTVSSVAVRQPVTSWQRSSSESQSSDQSHVVRKS